jgi:PKD repeat protein
VSEVGDGVNFAEKGKTTMNPQTATASTPTPTPAKRVYWMGNSLTDTLNYGGVAAMAANAGYPLIWGRQMIPGAPLEWIESHPNDGFSQSPYGTYPTALSSYTWDDISFQPFQRPLSDGNAVSGKGDLQVIDRFLNLVKSASPNAQVWIYESWPTKPTSGATAAFWKAEFNRSDANSSPTYPSRSFFEQLVVAVKNANPTLKAPKMIPIGQVMDSLNNQMAAGTIPGYSSVYDIYADEVHLNNTVGAYIAACTAYSSLYYADPRGNAVPSEYGAIPADLVKAIQNTVWSTVSSYSYSNGTYAGLPAPMPAPTPTPAPIPTPTPAPVVAPVMNIAPTAKFTVSAISGTAPLTVKFDPTGSTDSDGYLLGYKWNFGDGSASNYEISPAKTYASPGQYTVSLSVMDNSNVYSPTVTQVVSVTSAAASTSGAAAANPIVAPVVATPVPTVISPNSSQNSAPGTTPDSLIRSGGNEALVGDRGDNLLIGDGNDNLIWGKGGNDTLTGGGGNNQFIFDIGGRYRQSVMGASVITDFKTSADKIALTRSTFNKLKGNRLKRSDFASVRNRRAAAQSDALFTYVRRTGALFYNENRAASGFGQGGKFVELSPGLNLSVKDFLLIA